ncbi:MAG: TM2 domain-containing protein [Planctomycetota bacterium]
MSDDYPNDPAPPPRPVSADGKHPGAEKKMLCGILAILLGGLGIHKFVLGMNVPGIIMLVITVVCYAGSCFVVPIFGALAVQVIGVIEGVMYLTKTDEEFYQTYMVNKKEWF